MTRASPLILLGLGLMACTTKDGNGIQSSELRELDSFEAVRSDSSVPLVVDVGPDPAVEVFCDENLLPFVETSVQGDTLVVSLPPELVLTPMATCEVLVSTPSLDRVHATSTGDVLVQGSVSELSYVRNTGWGDVMIDGIDSQELRIISQNRGRVLLQGTAQVISLENSGASGIEAGELISADANVLNSGAGDIAATVTVRATVRIEGDGDVVLYGDPETIEVDDDGCGDLY